MKKIVKFFAGVVSELKKVRWPNIKSLAKYTGVTIIFAGALSLLFYGIDILVALIRTRV